MSKQEFPKWIKVEELEKQDNFSMKNDLGENVKFSILKPYRFEVRKFGCYEYISFTSELHKNNIKGFTVYENGLLFY